MLSYYMIKKNTIFYSFEFINFIANINTRHEINTIDILVIEAEYKYKNIK